ncbi:DUF3238 domain-containing protein [Paenibacillus yanchengensis]|uniref:DUF3238 domain-containing protein n=1 Tax=Paenibacillus yanchengensis TaxID=2035833 RepID=A0ABW4YIA6_9BACL
MANVVEVRLAAFIPQSWVTMYSTSKVLVQFNGNNREFTYFTVDQPELSKMVQHVAVNFNKKEIKHFKSIGSTIERTVDKVTGEVLREFTDTASDAGLVISNQSISNTSASFKLRGSAGNPLLSFADPIDWEYTVTVTNQGKVTVVGKHDGFPAHEIWKRVDNGTPVNIYKHDPRVTGDTPLALQGNMEISVNKSV